MQVARHGSPEPPASKTSLRALTSNESHLSPVNSLLACLLLNLAFVSLPAAAQTLDRIRESGHIRLGYFADARPFSYTSEGSRPQGYTITLCERIAAQIKFELSMPGITIDWKEVQPVEAMEQVRNGKIDVLCAPLSVSLEKRQIVSFSVPIFAAGNRAVIRTDAPQSLRNVLTQQSGTRPIWRGSPAATALTGTRVGVTKGTTTQKWLEERIHTFQLDAKLVPVADYRTGIQQLADRKLDIFFGERTVVLGALGTMDRAARESVEILDRRFTHEQLALALPRNDDDLRRAADTALSRLYASEQFPALYTKCCGEFDATTRSFFLWNTIQEGRP